MNILNELSGKWVNTKNEDDIIEIKSDNERMRILIQLRETKNEELLSLVSSYHTGNKPEKISLTCLSDSLFSCNWLIIKPYLEDEKLYIYLYNGINFEHDKDKIYNAKNNIGKYEKKIVSNK